MHSEEASVVRNAVSHAVLVGQVMVPTGTLTGGMRQENYDAPM
jgi:hypothetical protein